MNRPAHHALPPLHLLLALAVMAVWGTNFVVIKLALAHLPPLTLATLRFAFAFFPLALVLKRPQVPWRNLATYGVLIGAGQFGLLFTAMRADITPGLASLVVQVQVFFTIGLSMRLTGERLARWQLAALGLAVAGLAVIAVHTDATATPPPASPRWRCWCQCSAWAHRLCCCAKTCRLGRSWHSCWLWPDWRWA